MYKVLENFSDLQDVKKFKGGEAPYEYEVGETYPRKGYTPSPERIAELASDDNLVGRALIAKVVARPKKKEESKPEEKKASKKASSK